MDATPPFRGGLFLCSLGTGRPFQAPGFREGLAIAALSFTKTGSVEGFAPRRGRNQEAPFRRRRMEGVGRPHGGRDEDGHPDSPLRGSHTPAFELKLENGQTALH